jgi:hypothetical protein
VTKLARRLAVLEAGDAMVPSKCGVGVNGARYLGAAAGGVELALVVVTFERLLSELAPIGGAGSVLLVLAVADLVLCLDEAVASAAVRCLDHAVADAVVHHRHLVEHNPRSRGSR